MKPTTITQKIALVTRCFWGFVGLLVLNILTFWVPLFVAIQHPPGQDKIASEVMEVGIMIVGILAVFFIYKLSRTVKRNDIWFRYLFFVLIPISAPVALLLLCNRTHTELSLLGHRTSLIAPRMAAGLTWGVTALLGCVLIYIDLSGLWNDERLDRSGKQMTGTLEMVTREYVYFIPSGYMFTVAYAGRTRVLKADRELFLQNASPDGTFTHHSVSVVYLPDKPDVAELPGVPEFSPLMLLLGGILASISCKGLNRVIRNKPPYPSKEDLRTPPVPNAKSPKVRSFVVDSRGQTHVVYK
jgi:hypothetical protein